VPVDELHRAADVLARLVAAWCASPAPTR
jgi:hypothetical protein